VEFFAVSRPLSPLERDSTERFSVPLLGNRDDAIKMNAALELAQYKPLINKVFPFDQLKDAYEHAVSGDHMGKIVVNLVEGDQIE